MANFFVDDDDNVFVSIPALMEIVEKTIEVSDMAIQNDESLEPLGPGVRMTAEFLGKTLMRINNLALEDKYDSDIKKDAQEGIDSIYRFLEDQG